MSLVNTFPEIYRRYFGMDDLYEPDRSYTSQGGTPYDLTDVTERLDRAMPTISDKSTSMQSTAAG